LGIPTAYYEPLMYWFIRQGQKRSQLLLDFPMILVVMLSSLIDMDRE
jgi:hypothetical protein